MFKNQVINYKLLRRGSHNVKGLTPWCTKMTNCALANHYLLHIQALSINIIILSVNSLIIIKLNTVNSYNIYVHADIL
jgi:hypothetical protein